MKKIELEFIKFCLIGLGTTVINYISFYLLLNFLEVNYLLASSLGFVAGVFAGYKLNMTWTFNNKNSLNISLYLLVYLISLGISLVFLKVTVGLLNFNILIANFLAICITTITNFLGIKFKIPSKVILAFSKNNIKIVLKYIFTSPLFYMGLVVKLFFILLFSSELTHNFAEFGILKENNIIYPMFMTYIYKFFTVILFFVPKTIIYKVPILLADIILLLVFCSWLKEKYKLILLIYWLSPFLLYINYYSGSLDIIPVALLSISLFFLFKTQYFWTFLFLGIAISSKIPIILVFPLFLIYVLYIGQPIYKIICFFIISIITFLFININVLDTNFFNQSHNLILEFNISYSSFNNLKLYITPLVYIVLILQAYYLQIRSRDLFILSIGFVFGIILLFVVPLSGWYVWFLPFLIYFYVVNNKNSWEALYFLQIVALVYFLINSPEKIFYLSRLIEIPLNKLSLNTDKIISLLFTGLQGLLILNLFIIYNKGIYKLFNHPLISERFFLGLGGDSGTGKTTISKIIADIFPDYYVGIFQGDDTHKWERGDENWHQITHLDPKANNLNQEFDFLSNLNRKSRLKRKHYDHNIGKFIDKKINNISTKLIIYEGLHPFFIKKVREIFGAKIFVKPDNDLKLHWKISRDTKKRNYTKEQILAQIKKREKDFEQYINSQEKFADIIISFMPCQKIKNLGDDNEKIDLYLELKITNSLYIENIIENLKVTNSLQLDHNYFDENYQVLSIKGNISKEKIENIAASSLPLSKIGVHNPIWHNNYYGILQLIIMQYILEQADID